MYIIIYIHTHHTQYICTYTCIFILIFILTYKTEKPKSN